jgi:hypothetical protein
MVSYQCFKCFKRYRRSEYIYETSSIAATINNAVAVREITIYYDNCKSPANRIHRTKPTIGKTVTER